MSIQGQLELSVKFLIKIENKDNKKINFKILREFCLYKWDDKVDVTNEKLDMKSSILLVKILTNES